VSKKTSYRISVALIILSLLFSQLGLNLMHTHQGFPPESSQAFSAPSSGVTPCKACSLDVMPTLYVEDFHIASLEPIPVEFYEKLPVAELQAATSSSSGRAPPVR
jgi:hypothetical protein